MQAEVLQREPKAIGQLRVMEKKAIILDALAAQGFNDHQAAKLMCIAPSYPAALKDKRDKGLLAPLAKIARKSIKAMAQGQVVGSMTEIKGSDVLGACKEIMSRAEPIVNKQEIKSTHLNIDITSEDMARIDALMGRRMIAQDLSNVPEAEIVANDTLCITDNDKQ